jgi:predicted cation transporter
MSKIDQGKPVTIFINIVLLFFVAIEPYLLNILNINAQLFPLSSALYGIDMAFLMGLSAALCHILIKENKTILTTQQLRYFTMSRNRQLVCAGLLFFSLLPQFLEWTLAGMPVRVFIWFATLAFSLTLSALNRNK